MNKESKYPRPLFDGTNTTTTFEYKGEQVTFSEFTDVGYGETAAADISGDLFCRWLGDEWEYAIHLPPVNRCRVHKYVTESELECDAPDAPRLDKDKCIEIGNVKLTVG